MRHITLCLANIACALILFTAAPAKPIHAQPAAGNAATTNTLALREIPYFGVQLHSLQGEPERHRRAVDLMVEAGIQIGRDECHWSNVEKTKGALVIPPNVITNLDYTVEKGREILLLLNYSNPLYDGGKPPASPEGIAAFARYCRAVVEATRGKVRYFGVWNEPNADGFWPPKADAKAYAKLLKAASAAIRGANPEAVILAPATSGYAEDFLREMLKEPGVWESFDVLSFHPYCHPASPEAAQKFEQLDALMEELKAQGAPKPVWLTEFGYHTADMGGVTEREQAAYLVRFYLLAMTRPYISGVVWYWLGPDGPNQDWGEDRFGLVREDYSKKQSYIFYKSIIHALHDVFGIEYVKDYSTGEFYCFQFSKGYFSGDCVSSYPILAAWSKGDTINVELSHRSKNRTLIYILDSFDPFVMEPAEESRSIYFTLTKEPVLIRPTYDYEFIASNSMAPSVLILDGSTTVFPGFGVTIPVFPKNIEHEYVIDMRTPYGSSIVLADVQDDNTVEVYCKRLASIGPQPVEFHFLNPASISNTKFNQTRFFIHRMDFATSEPISLTINPVISDIDDLLAFQISWINNYKFELRPLTSHYFYNQEQKFYDKAQALSIAPGQQSTINRDNKNPFDHPIIRDPSDTVYQIKSRVLIPGGWQSDFENIITFQKAHYYKELQIDGDLSDWKPAGNPIRIGERWQVTGEFRPWRGPEDSHARVWTAWNDEWFYFAAEYEDDVFCAEFDDWQVYRNDGFELYFDIDHDGDRAVKSYNEDDFQWGVFPTKAGPVVWRWAHYNSASPGAKFVFNPSPRPEQTISGKQFTGYIYEAALPMSELKWKPRAGQHIGFNVTFTDADDPEFVHPFGQEVQLGWSGRPNNHLTPHSFADLFLAGHTENKSEK